MTFEESALIVAGGKGRRFGSRVPKQFVELRGKPVLIHTLEAFYRYSENINIVLVLPKEELAAWDELVHRYDYRRPVVVEEGGATRFQSVKRGLQRLTSEGYVAIHDGVRPLISTDIIAKSFRLARTHRAAIATVALKESLRLVSPETPGDTLALDRSRYRMVQTPQTFEISLIRKAYDTPEDESLTDDASVAERAGFPVYLFEGDYRNIKITNPEDLAMAEAIMGM